MEYLVVVAAMATPFVLYGVFIFVGHLRKRHAESKPTQALGDSDNAMRPEDAAEEKEIARMEKIATKNAKREAKEQARQEKKQAKIEARKARDEAKIVRKSERASRADSVKAFSRSEPSLGGEVAEQQNYAEPSFETSDQTLETDMQADEMTDFADVEPQPVEDYSTTNQEGQVLPEDVSAIEPEQQEPIESDAVTESHESETLTPEAQERETLQQEEQDEDETSKISNGAGTDKEDVFPSLDPDVLNEYYYYVANMSVPSGMPGVTALQMATELIQKTKLERFQVLLGHNPEVGKWEKPRPDKSYSYLVWAVPLCSRESNISKEEMGNTVKVIQDRMRKSGGKASFPSHHDIEERLVEVDNFCNDVDHKMTVFLLANKESGGQPQRSGDIIELAIHEKMEEVNGRIVRMVNGENWYVLDTGIGEPLGKKSPDRRLANLMLWMDVPHVSKVEAAFDEMFDMARKLARVLGFSLVNEDQQPIDDEMIDNTRAFISQRCNYMLERGVRPGSKLARALFS